MRGCMDRWMGGSVGKWVGWWVGVATGESITEQVRERCRARSLQQDRMIVLLAVGPLSDESAKWRVSVDLHAQSEFETHGTACEEYREEVSAGGVE